MKDGYNIDYYNSDRYKGFYKSQVQDNNSSRFTQLIYTDGSNNFTACGLYLEDAMFKIFAAIDKFYLDRAQKAEAAKKQPKYKRLSKKDYSREELPLAEAV